MLLGLVNTLYFAELSMKETTPDIRDQLKSSDLFDAFKQQLTKDFEQSNFSTDFIAGLEANYNSLLERIIVELEQHQKRGEAALMPLLNRIDISEAQLKRYLKESEDNDPITVIATLIIKRVLQKVVIKQYYKKEQSHGDAH